MIRKEKVPGDIEDIGDEIVDEDYEYADDPDKDSVEE